MVQLVLEESGLDELTRLTVEACTEVHRRLGPGLTEATYEQALCQELTHRKLPFQRQVPLPVFYRGVRLEAAYRVDVCIAGRVVVDVRSVDAVLQVHRSELRSRLRVTGLSVGLIVNFHTARLAQGLVLIRRTRTAKDRDASPGVERFNS
jgi:GxxExxY protein